MENSSPGKQLRSQSKHNPTAKQVRDLTAWARGVLGARMDNEDFAGKIPGFCSSYPLDWVEGAILIGSVGAKPNKLASYVNACLAAWYAAGKPSYEEISAARSARASPARPEPERADLRPLT